MTAPHAHRPADGRHKRKHKATVAQEYAPGYFCELIFAHNWPPRFESVGRWTSARHAAPHVISAQSRAGQGFDAHGIDLPGSRVHVENWKARQAREASK